MTPMVRFTANTAQGSHHTIPMQNDEQYFDLMCKIAQSLCKIMHNFRIKCAKSCNPCENDAHYFRLNVQIHAALTISLFFSDTDCRTYFSRQIQGSRWLASQFTTDYRGQDCTASFTIGNPDLINESGT